MKKYAFALLPLLSLAALSCEPRVFTMNIDMRHPSTSGMDFSGKTMSVVWLDDLSGRDEAFSPALAESFSQTLETTLQAGMPLRFIAWKRISEGLMPPVTPL